MTVEIFGRTRYADEATTKVTICRHGETVAIIHGGLIEQRRDGGEFVLSAKHLTAVDDEGDSAYVAYFEGAGLRLDSMLPTTISMTGVLLSARYDAEIAPDAERARFTPPTQKWEPGVYEIIVRFLPTAEEG